MINQHEDYSESEIRNIVSELLDNHYSKLMSWEINVLENIKTTKTTISSEKRDWLVGIYDRIGENNYD